MVFLTEMVIEQMKNAQNAKQGQNKVVIIQSLNNLQIMLPELGYVNALRAYLEFNKIDYQIDERSNAEWMSPDGQLPLIKYGRQLVSGFLPIIEFINKQFEIKVNDISTERQAILDLFNKVIIDAELYYTWLDKDTFEKYTKFSYAYGKPWPLNNILCWLKRRDIAWRIQDDTNRQNSLEEFLREISRITSIPMDDDKAASRELLCLIYGHIKAINSYDKTYEPLRKMVKQYPSLLQFVEKF
ncbi:metaxin-2-like [Dermatophagoides pteronyssinus]|uniref:metaxin-2-like n=1 Tax=Dermatophagoides pteronyssinus TaxID=6956 RepID=UPI003F67DDFE